MCDSECVSGFEPATSCDREAVFGSEPGSDSDSSRDSVSDPFDDADALGELEHEIVTLAAHIAAATHRLLVLIAEFDRRRGWELGGHRSCAHWLHAMTGVDLGAAREKVRTARALVSLPRTSETMARGELSYSAVRALTRVATPECEEELLEVAKTSTTAQLERFVRTWRVLSRADEAKLERARWRSRRLSVFPDDEGMYGIKGRLPAETGALLMRAIEAASDALFGTEPRDEAREQDGEEITPKQRRADAMGLVAERAMAMGFGGERREARERGENGKHGSGGEWRARVDDEADGEADDVSAETSEASAPVSGTRAERYQVMLHVDARVLENENKREQEQDRPSLDVPRSHLEDGTRVSAETSRRLSCDAAVVEVVRGEREKGGSEAAASVPSTSSVLDVGRRTRTIPPALRRALEVRDRGCRFPGCGLRFTDGHHIEHWADGGETRLHNLILLCGFHHRLVHEGGWRVEFWGRGEERRPAFLDPRGGIRMDVELESRRPVELPEHPVEALVHEHRAEGIEPDGWSLGPRLPSPPPGALSARGEPRSRSRTWRPADARREIRDRAVDALDAAHFGG